MFCLIFGVCNKYDKETQVVIRFSVTRKMANVATVMFLLVEKRY